TATVVESHVESHLKSPSNNRNRSTVTINVNGGGGSRTYSAVITYRYSVDGQSYTSHRYWYEGGGSSSQSGADALAAEYAAGKQVTAYYDPKNPAEAVLNNEAPDQMVIMVSLGFLWLCVVAVLVKG